MNTFSRLLLRIMLVCCAAILPASAQPLWTFTVNISFTDDRHHAKWSNEAIDWGRFFKFSADDAFLFALDQDSSRFIKIDMLRGTLADSFHVNRSIAIPGYSANSAWCLAPDASKIYFVKDMYMVSTLTCATRQVSTRNMNLTGSQIIDLKITPDGKYLLTEYPSDVNQPSFMSVWPSVSGNRLRFSDLPSSVYSYCWDITPTPDPDIFRILSHNPEDNSLNAKHYLRVTDRYIANVKSNLFEGVWVPRVPAEQIQPSFYKWSEWSPSYYVKHSPRWARLARDGSYMVCATFFNAAPNGEYNDFLCEKLDLTTLKPVTSIRSLDSIPLLFFIWSQKYNRGLAPVSGGFRWFDLDSMKFIGKVASFGSQQPIGLSPNEDHLLTMDTVRSADGTRKAVIALWDIRQLIPTSVEENHDSTVPATRLTHSSNDVVEFSAAGAWSYRIQDVLGKTILAGQTERRISLQTVSVGVYFITATNERGESVTAKIIRN